MNKIKRLNFFLFDGEGADGGEGGLGQEASDFMDSLDGKPKNQPNVKPDLSKVEYGSEGKGKASQVGSDKGVSAPNENVDKEFAELIGKDGKYHDIYGQMVSKAIQERFKNQPDYQDQIDGYADATAPLFKKYNLEAGDIEGLAKAIAEDDDLYNSRAEELGIDVNQLKKNLKLEADAERGRKITEEYYAEQQRNAMFRQWESEAEELKETFPGFDLGNEIHQNPDFIKMLDAGIPVKNAFAATHMEDILEGYGNAQNVQATEQVVNNFKKQAARPVESGMSHSPATARKVNPSTFTNEDMDEILRRVENEGYVFKP